MKTFLLLCLLLTACEPSGPVGKRVVTVSIDCPPPASTYALQEVLSFGWQYSATGEVLVQCGEIPSVGEYVLGSHTVTIDPTRASGEFALRAAVGHELVHWLIYQGPHPERARYHVCTWPRNDPPPPLCYPGVAAANALMSHASAAEPTLDWSTENYTGPLDEYRVTEADQALIDWGLTP